MRTQATTSGDAPRPYRPSDALGGDRAISREHPRVPGPTGFAANRAEIASALVDEMRLAKFANWVGQYIMHPAGHGKEVLEAGLDRAHDADPAAFDLLLDREGSLLYQHWPYRKYFDSIGSPNVRVVLYQERLLPWNPPIYHPKLAGRDIDFAQVVSGGFDEMRFGENAALLRGLAAAQAYAEHTASWVSAGGQIADHQRALLELADRRYAAGPVEAATGVRLIANRPGVDMGASRYVLESMRKAQQRIWIQTPFLGSKAVIREALAAKARGVDVRILVPAPGADAAPPAVVRLNRTNFAELMHGADPIPIFEQRGHFDHDKIYVVDDEVVLGSLNAAERAIEHDNELIAVSNEPELVARVERRWADNAMTAHLMTRADLETLHMRMMSGGVGKVIQRVLNRID